MFLYWNKLQFVCELGAFKVHRNIDKFQTGLTHFQFGKLPIRKIWSTKLPLFSPEFLQHYTYAGKILAAYFIEQL